MIPFHFRSLAQSRLRSRVAKCPPMTRSGPNKQTINLQSLNAYCPDYGRYPFTPAQIEGEKIRPPLKNPSSRSHSHAVQSLQRLIIKIPALREFLRFVWPPARQLICDRRLEAIAMSQVTSVAPFMLAAKPERGHLRPVIGRLSAVAEKLLSRQRQREHFIASRYAGCSWGDATERRINDDIAKCNWTRI